MEVEESELQDLLLDINYQLIIAVHLGHLCQLYSAVLSGTLVPKISEQLNAAISDLKGAAYTEWQ